MSVLLEDPGRIMEINEEGSSFGKWMIVQRSIMRKKESQELKLDRFYSKLKARK